MRIHYIIISYFRSQMQLNRLFPKITRCLIILITRSRTSERCRCERTYLSIFWAGYVPPRTNEIYPERDIESAPLKAKVSPYSAACGRLKSGASGWATGWVCNRGRGLICGSDYDIHVLRFLHLPLKNGSQNCKVLLTGKIHMTSILVLTY